MNLVLMIKIVQIDDSEASRQSASSFILKILHCYYSWAWVISCGYCRLLLLSGRKSGYRY